MPANSGPEREVLYYSEDPSRGAFILKLTVCGHVVERRASNKLPRFVRCELCAAGPLVRTFKEEEA